MNHVESEIARSYREQELRRRAIRRARLLNEAALDTESPPPDEVEAAAWKNLAIQEARHRSKVGRGYWKTLWFAILGRLS